MVAGLALQDVSFGRSMELNLEIDLCLKVKTNRGSDTELTLYTGLAVHKDMSGYTNLADYTNLALPNLPPYTSTVVHDVHHRVDSGWYLIWPGLSVNHRIWMEATRQEVGLDQSLDSDTDLS